MVKRFDDDPTFPMRGLQIWQILIGAAHDRRILTYGHIADLLGFKGAGTLANMLGHVFYFCEENNLPPLTALVVNQKTGLPGHGMKSDDLNADRETVYAFNWFALVPPTPNELGDAYARGHAAQQAIAPDRQQPGSI